MPTSEQHRPIGTVSGQQSSLPAILLIICAVFSLSVMDASVKAISSEMGTIQALWARYGGQFLIVMLIVMPRLKTVAKTEFLGLNLLRSCLLMLATFFFFTGLSIIDLADAAAVMNLNPVLITAGAALFLGEQLGSRRIVAIFIAMLGALIIIRPGTGAFSAPALYPLLAAICFAAYTLITRKIGIRENLWTSLFYTGLVGTIILSIMVPFFWSRPDVTSALLLLLIAGAGTTGQLLIIKALGMAPASTVAPFFYLGLVFSTLWGITLFGETPDHLTLLGALVITGAGLYVWHRERRLDANRKIDQRPTA